MHKLQFSDATMWNFKMGKLRTKPQFGSLKSPSFAIISINLIRWELSILENECD